MLNQSSLTEALPLMHRHSWTTATAWAARSDCPVGGNRHPAGYECSHWKCATCGEINRRNYSNRKEAKIEKEAKAVLDSAKAIGSGRTDRRGFQWYVDAGALDALGIALAKLTNEDPNP